MLDVAVARELGAFRLDVTLRVAPGETLVVIGESGSGKSTLLRLLAGLIEPDQGRIAVGSEVWYDGAAKVMVPPWQRAIGYLPQDYALFPHLSVAENVAFGLRAGGMPRREALTRAAGALERLGVGDLAGAAATAISGGQQQRVALARALVLEPALLLLDEPLAALDRRTRASALTELERLLATLGCITIYVTHAPEEAEGLGRVVELEEGTMIESRSPRTDDR